MSEIPTARFATGLQRLMAILFFALAFLAACHRPTQHRYPLTGNILDIDRTTHQLIVQHHDIPNYMKGMTMSFPVKDNAVLDHLHVGQIIDATLVVTDRESWLENIKVIGEQATEQPAPKSEFQIPSESAPVPDFVFTNQDGKQVHLAQYKGKVLLVTFIYTRCPLPDFCPRMTNNFLEIEKSLKQDPAAYGRTHLLSITFDPKFDTPKVLRHYALSTTSIPAANLFPHWEFLSPRVQDIDAIAHFFALSVWREQGQITHSLSTVIIDSNGKLYRWHHGNDWTVDELLRETRTATGEN